MKANPSSPPFLQKNARKQNWPFSLAPTLHRKLQWVFQAHQLWPAKTKTLEICYKLPTSKNLRLYLTDDIIGAQVAGAIKNVIAIACGIVQGLGLGESARAALITRGLAEISRLTMALGGKRETLMGQCGVGDMMLTCSSMKSRNFSCGVELANGKTMQHIIESRNAVTEGLRPPRPR